MRKLILYICIMLVGLPSALAKGYFAMNPTKAQAYMPLVLNVLTGDVQAGNPGDNSEGLIEPESVNPITGKKTSCFEATQFGGRKYVGFGNADKGSVAVISITDAIMKYDYCGAMGTVSINGYLQDAIASENITGILLNMDTPGGEVYGTKNLSDTVGNCPKPIIAHINDGYCASAGMYIACKADKILMAQPTDQVGSIGVYTTLIDSKGAWEKQGYKLVTIYSPKSPDKNSNWHKAVEEGDVKPMEEELAFLDEIFMNQVKEGRGDKLKDEALRGGMFYTDKAIELGLCDGYASFDQAIEEVINLSDSSQIIST